MAACFADDGIEEGERFPVLHGRIAAADDAEHVETVLAGHGVFVGHRQAQEAVLAIAGVEGSFLTCQSRRAAWMASSAVAGLSRAVPRPCQGTPPTYIMLASPFWIIRL